MRDGPGLLTSLKNCEFQIHRRRAGTPSLVKLVVCQWSVRCSYGKGSETMRKPMRKTVVLTIMLIALVVGLGTAGVGGGFCPDCNSCPPQYSEEVSWAECSECSTSTCWIVWLIHEGWPWFINIADKLRIPNTSYYCWHTTTCIDDCMPMECEM